MNEASPPDLPRWTLHADLTPDDWKAFIQFIVRRYTRTSTYRITYWGFALGSGVIMGLLSSCAGFQLHLPSMFVGFVISIIGINIIARIQTRHLSPAPDGHLLGPRQITLTDEGVKESSPRYESLTRWQCIREVQLTDHHLFLMVDNNAAIIIPRRVFNPGLDAGRFAGEVSRHITPPSPLQRLS